MGNFKLNKIYKKYFFIKNNLVYLFFSFSRSLKKEGLNKSTTRLINFLKYGKGVLDKKDAFHQEKFFPLELILENFDLENNDERFWLDLKKSVDIIIPVYNGYEYLKPLFESIFKNTAISYRLIVIDDCSPDKKIWEYLEKIKKENPEKDILLMRNEKNLGFVKTVNKAVKYVKNHFVIVNTDIEVPPGWLERLIHPIIKNKKIASATPFTNSGTICSFPEFVKDNGIFENLSVEELNKYFQLVKAKDNYVEMPTGVGFCMAFNKKVADEIGMFDEESFGKGYGEENDWSQRAIKKGYKNVIVQNLFVYHKHGGSFQSEEKKKLMEENLKKLLKKHPNYTKDVEEFILKDDLRDLRGFLIMLISAGQGEAPILFINHELGGGADYYRKDFVKGELKKNKKILMLSYDFRNREYHVTYNYKKYVVWFSFAEFESLLKLLKFIKISKIILSQVASYSKPLEIIKKIEKIKESQNCFLEILIHDYFCVCPNVVPLSGGRYCDIPSLVECERCLVDQKTNEYSWFIKKSDRNIYRWRNGWGRIFQKAEKIIVFSDSSKEILKKVYPKITDQKIEIKPHTVDYIKAEKLEDRVQKNKLIIGVAGGIDRIKGSEIIKEMLEIIENKKINAEIVVIGEYVSRIKIKFLKITGKYQREKLPELAKKYDIDVFFMSSIIPETFSYITEEIIQMNYPIASFNLGAQAERVKKHKKGYIISKVNAEEALDVLIKANKNEKE